MITLNGMEGKELPVYGRGNNVRDWRYVDDHAAALDLVVMCGTPGSTYVVGGREERSNVDVVTKICDLIDQRCGLASHTPRRELVRHVSDWPGHDQRYAIDPSKIESRERPALRISSSSRPADPRLIWKVWTGSDRPFGCFRRALCLMPPPTPPSIRRRTKLNAHGRATQTPPPS